MSKLPINQIIHGDCLEVMKSFPDKSIDLVLTDPPYGIGLAKGTITTYGQSIDKGRRYEGDWDNATPSKEYFDEMLRVGKNVVIFGGQFFTDKLPVNGHWVVWDKKGDIQFDNPFGDCELIYTNVNRKSVKKYTVIQQGFITEDKSPRLHPTQKPVSLMEKLVEEYSEEGGVVLDPFSGSCTTCAAAISLKRNYICIEREEKYANVCLERLQTTTAPMF